MSTVGKVGYAHEGGTLAGTIAQASGVVCYFGSYGSNVSLENDGVCLVNSGGEQQETNKHTLDDERKAKSYGTEL